MTYWHFASIVDGKPVMRDGIPIELGRRYTVPRAEMCRSGFHGSLRAIDALNYAPGPWVSKRVIQVTDERLDKVVGPMCVHILGADATEVLWEFARYLRPGYEPLRWDVKEDIALHAARRAAWNAGWDSQNGKLTEMLKKLLSERGFCLSDHGLYNEDTQ